MCQKVYHTCAYCGAHRFAQWEECAYFWRRYCKLIGKDGKIQEHPLAKDCEERSATLRFLAPGTCPRLHTCMSLVDFTRARPKRAMDWAASVGAIAGRRNGAQRLARNAEEERKQGSEQRKKQRQEFADLWFQKRAVPILRHCTPAPEQLCVGSRETSVAEPGSPSVDADGGLSRHLSGSLEEYALQKNT